MLDEVTTIGLFLTLVGLLGSFFWVSLTAWLRDLVALEAQATYWQARQKDEEKAKIRHQVKGLGDWTTYVTTLAVLIFGVVLVVEALQMADGLKGELGDHLRTALWSFLVLFIVLTLFLLLRGYLLVRSIKAKAKETASTGSSTTGAAT